MRKTAILYVLIACLTSCDNNSKQVSIQGEIKGLRNDTLYLYGGDRNLERIDTIITKDGKIDYTFKIDTITSAILLINNKTQVPLFLDKKEKITIEGNGSEPDFLIIKGNTANEEYTAFQQALKGLGKPSAKVLEKKAEDFIREHHSSPVSVYLLNKYFAQKEVPDYTKIKFLIEPMAGNLQDNPIIEQLKTYSEQAEKVSVGHSAPFFSLRNAKGEKITRADKFKDKYLLIHFWASWDSLSMKENTKLRKINREYKKNKNFGMLGISLDIDKATWKGVIKRDTLNWEQVCDFAGLNSETVTQYAVFKIPCNILINPNGQIIARDAKKEDIKRLVINDKEKR